MGKWPFAFSLNSGVAIGLCAVLGACSSENQVYGTIQLLPKDSTKKTEIPVNSGDVNSSEQKGSGAVQNSADQKDGSGLEQLGPSTIVEGAQAIVGQRSVSTAFDVSKTYDASLGFKIKSAGAAHEITQHITMRKESLLQSAQFRQISNPTEVEQFIQGGREQNINQLLNQNAMGVLDLLIVIDDSYSMREEQEKLSTKLSPLLSKISSSDWRIGVITTDYRNGMRDVINKGDFNADEKFKNAIRAGIYGSVSERGIYQSIKGLSTQGFLRAGSSVAVLIVSDEDNTVTGPYGLRNSSYSYQSLLSFLTDTAKRKLGDTARVYGIIHEPESDCNTAMSEGKDYAQAVLSSKGKMGSICDEDYTSTLNAISNDVKSILQSSWQLKSLPAAGSLVVKIDDKIVSESSYAVEGRTLTFKVAPPAVAKIEVAYKTLDSALLTRYKILKKIVVDSESISVAGRSLIRGVDYSMIHSGDESEVVFNADKIPSANDLVNVTYKLEMPLQAVFSLDAPAEDIEVKVNGVLTPVAFDSQSQSLTFSPPPPEAAEINVSYRAPGVQVLTYPISLGQASPQDLKVIDAQSNGLLSAANYSLASDSIVFEEAEFIDGRRLVVVYSDSKSENLSEDEYKLPMVPDLFSKLEVRNTNGVLCGENGDVVTAALPWILTDDILKLQFQCGWGAGTDFTVSFKHSKIENEFEMKTLSETECDQAKWEVVLIKADQSQKFITRHMDRKGCRFSPKPQTVLPPDAKIVITGSI